jgi:hypothetical protein
MSTFEFPERRNMTVSFTDLRGFTSMSEGLSPEEVREVINTYLDDIIRAVDDNGNTVDKIVGDEVMALYGAPRYFQNHALRAVIWHPSRPPVVTWTFERTSIHAAPSSTCCSRAKNTFKVQGTFSRIFKTSKDHRAPSPSKYRSGIPEDLDVVIQKGLDPDPEQRYTDLESLQADLKAVLEGLPIMARRDNALQKVTRWCKRRKSLSITLAASFVAIVGLSITHVTQMSKTLTAYEEAEARAEAERLKALGSISDLQKALVKAIENEDWE